MNEQPNQNTRPDTRPVVRDIKPVPKEQLAWQHKNERKAKRGTLFVALAIMFVTLLLASIVIGVMLGSR